MIDGTPSYTWGHIWRWKTFNYIISVFKKDGFLAARHSLPCLAHTPERKVQPNMAEPRAEQNVRLFQAEQVNHVQFWPWRLIDGGDSRLYIRSKRWGTFHSRNSSSVLISNESTSTYHESKNVPKKSTTKEEKNNVQNAINLELLTMCLYFQIISNPTWRSWPGRDCVEKIRDRYNAQKKRVSRALTGWAQLL